MAGMELDQAIREFLTGNWLLPYESVAYVMVRHTVAMEWSTVKTLKTALGFVCTQGIFAEVFLAKNPEYKLRDETMLQGLANALIMLNGFQHNVQSKRTQMSLKRFTELVRSFDITEVSHAVVFVAVLTQVRELPLKTKRLGRRHISLQRTSRVSINVFAKMT